MALRRIFWTLLVVGIPVAVAAGSVLDDYVRLPDEHFGYKSVGAEELEKHTVHLLDMTSQSWLSPELVDRHVWEHRVIIVVPKQIESDTALLWISGGGNGRASGRPNRPEPILERIAVATKSVTGLLCTVPNQPLTFSSEYKDRDADGVIAYSMQKYAETGDPNWPALLPMTKAAVRGMDAVNSYVRGLGNGICVNNFVLTGASKRGWTSYLAGAADARVVALIPIVYDNLNMGRQMRHHFAAYGCFSSALDDYRDARVFDHLNTSRAKMLHKMIDPYEYRRRLTMPKCLIHSTGDQYFLPDSARFYFDELPGQKYLRYVPNTQHSLAGSDAGDTILAFYGAIVDSRRLPRFTWKITEGDEIVVRAADEPDAVRLWQAHNDQARDFRLETIGPAWRAKRLAPKEKALYVARVAKPKAGWTAFFVELTYGMGEEPPLKCTTEVHVIPHTLPHADKLTAGACPAEKGGRK